MPREIVRNPLICGGAPTIDGTRLTCANVVQFPQGVDFLATYPYLSKEDLETCLSYCAQQRCLVDNQVRYCEGCSLDRSPPAGSPDAFVQSLDDVRHLHAEGEMGQVFLGTPEESEAGLQGKDLWKLAAERLTNRRGGSASEH